MAGPAGGRDWLSRTLRDLRHGTGLSGVAAAKAVGISQPRISRIENGVLLPTDFQVRAMCRVYGAPARTERELRQAVADLRAESAPARLVLSRGGWKMQSRIRAIEARAAEICGYQPAIIVGLLQTEAYMRLVFTQRGQVAGDLPEKSVAERLKRASVLGSDKDITLILTEGALRWQAGSPAVMVEQLEHIRDVSVAFPQVQIGVIPQTQAVSVFPTHGFAMWDRRTVMVGMWSATSVITDATDVAGYSRLFDQLVESARFGAGGQEIVGRIAAEYRRMS